MQQLQAGECLEPGPLQETDLDLHRDPGLGKDRGTWSETESDLGLDRSLNSEEDVGSVRGADSGPERAMCTETNEGSKMDDQMVTGGELDMVWVGAEAGAAVDWKMCREKETVSTV